MLAKTNTITNTSKSRVKAFSITIFFYLTNNSQGSLMPFLQQYKLTLERLKGKGHLKFTKRFPFFYKNANFFAQSHEYFSLEDFVVLSKFLLSKTIVVAIFYDNQVWTLSRLKEIQKNSFLGMKKSCDCNKLWKSLSQQNF